MLNATMRRKIRLASRRKRIPRSGYTPWRTLRCAAMLFLMKQDTYFQKQTRNLSRALRPSLTVASPHVEPAFAPSAKEVVRNVGLKFMHQALQPWREVQLWLAAEAELFADQELVPVRVRSVHHRHY